MEGWNKTILWGMTLGILLYALAAPLHWLDYRLRKDYIAEVLCINRDKPEMNCHGKCFLSKQIQKTQDNKEDQGQSESNAGLFTFTVFFPEAFLLKAPLPFILQHQTTYYSYYFYQLSSGIFHPPSLLS